jgi:hypothetical protein
MSSVSLGKKRLERLAAAAMLAFTLLSGPTSTFASTILPNQVLPPAMGQACAPVTFSDIQAHVYSDGLDSFDITISDSSYVAVSTTIENTPIGFNYITRWQNPDGTLKMHVDLQPTPVNRGVPVQITFLSVHPDQNGASVTCIFQVPATIPAATASNEGQAATGGAPSTHVAHPQPKQGTGGQSGQHSGSTSSQATGTNPGTVSAMSSLGNLCVDGGATRLWVVLLVLFALFCFILCAQKFEVNSSVRDWNIGLILAVFVALLIFWYVSAACRTAGWAPALATLITIAGLLYTMLKSDDTQEILLLKDGKK